MNKNSHTPAITGAALTEQNLMKQVSQAYNSPRFTVLIAVDGIDRNTGREFHSDFILDQSDPEFIAMLNDYGARKSAETSDIKRGSSPCKDVQKSLELMLLLMVKGCDSAEEIAFVKSTPHYRTALNALEKHKSLAKK